MPWKWEIENMYEITLKVLLEYRECIFNSFSSSEVNDPRTESFLSFCCWTVTWSGGISSGVSAYLYYPVLIQRAIKMSLGTFSASLLVCLRVLLHLCSKFLRPEPAFITEFVNSILYCWEGKEIEEWELESAFTVVYSVVQVPWLMSWPYGNAG